MKAAMPELHISATTEEASQANARFVADLAQQCAADQGRFTIALSGGSTPRRLYQVLASPPYSKEIEWDRWHVFWSDERCVPPDHNDSNYRMARETLLDCVPVPGSQVHRMRGEGVPREAAAEYEDYVRDVFRGQAPSFELILPGIGNDDHTASLFPGSQALQEQDRLVVDNLGAGPSSAPHHIHPAADQRGPGGGLPRYRRDQGGSVATGAGTRHGRRHAACGFGPTVIRNCSLVPHCSGCGTTQRGQGLKYICAITRGAPAQNIIDHVKKHSINRVLMSTHGHGVLPQICHSGGAERRVRRRRMGMGSP